MRTVQLHPAVRADDYLRDLHIGGEMEFCGASGT
jgi:hypothetical protein